MEKVGSTASAQFTSGRVNPGFSKKVDALQLNAFAKAKGLELFGTYEVRPTNEKQVSMLSMLFTDWVQRKIYL
jgi:hypothetical protein